MRPLLFDKKSFATNPLSFAGRLEAAISAAPYPSQAEARQWLVFAGQLEQAVLDAGGSPDVAKVTDCAAELFLAERSAAPREAVLKALRALSFPSGEVTVRIPEGFAWYALYPESYAAAAEQWAAAQAGARVLVIGLRSIGTSLSAVVAATLSRRGFTVTRMSVRPQGHPFRREVLLELPHGVPDQAIIVDEGPGLSGSSMAAAADALAALGVEETAIWFFPGHGNGPGARADSAIQRWWAAGRCWVGSADFVLPKIEGAQWTFGGFAAVNPHLETGAQVKRQRQARMAALGFALPSPAEADGWIAFPDAGESLTREEPPAGFQEECLPGYIAACALPSPHEDVIPAALARIAAAVDGLERDIDRVFAFCRDLPLAGDGRLGPSGWFRAEDGRVLKRNATGADCEHDWSGLQCLLWDVAGAMIEWEMEEKAQAALLRRLHEAHGIMVEPLALSFHAAGYSALHLARAEHAGDEKAAVRYTRFLEKALQSLERER